MNQYQLPIAKQELLHHMLQVGGQAACFMTRPAETIQATFDVELSSEYVLVSVDVAGRTDQLKLRRGDRANHLHLRELLLNVANHQSIAPELDVGARHEPHP